MTTAIIKDFYVKCKCEFIRYDSDLIITWDVELNLMIIFHDNPNDVESTITTPEVQNYHFTPRDNMLGLISKNYYKKFMSTKFISQFN